MTTHLFVTIGATAIGLVLIGALAAITFRGLAGDIAAWIVVAGFALLAFDFASLFLA